MRVNSDGWGAWKWKEEEEEEDEEEEEEDEDDDDEDEDLSLQNLHQAEWVELVELSETLDDE
jgi:hypothetical protein